MRIAYTSTFDARDVHNWSGTPYHMSKALSQAGLEVDYIGSLQRQLPRFFKLKQIVHKYLSDQRESPRFNIHAAKAYSEQVAIQLQQRPADIVVSPLINPIAYLDCKAPIILWTDAVYAGLVGFYPPFANHSAATIQQGNAMTQACLTRCHYAVFASDWAAQHAIQFYGVSKDKVKVIPFGANIDTFPNYAEVQTFIHNRSRETIKLLFLAKSWERKGGDIVVAVAKALHQAGHKVELTIVGYEPPQKDQLPPYIKCLGFISKHTPEGQERLQRILATSHFLFVPSRAEAYGIVFCEANAYGVPCLTTYVGGIGTVVKDHINGMTFGLDAPVTRYCDYIVNIFGKYHEYQSLALSAYHEFTSRLNWRAAVNEMQKLMQSI